MRVGELDNSGQPLFLCDAPATRMIITNEYLSLWNQIRYEVLFLCDEHDKSRMT